MSSGFGNVIKQWRGFRRFSQLALSIETGLSSRHISFLETGRSRPSRSAVMTLARVLDMPRPAVNEALLAAGFAPEYRALALTDEELAPAMQAIEMILANHAPMPAIVIDGMWNIVGGNRPAQTMMTFLPMQGSLSVIAALFNDDPADPVFLNWSTIATWTLLRLQAEISKAGSDSPLVPLYERLVRDPRLKPDDMASFSDYGPVLTMNVKIDEYRLSLITMLAEFSTVQDLAMSERRVELFFPADAATRLYFERLDKD